MQNKKTEGEKCGEKRERTILVRNRECVPSQIKKNNQILRRKTTRVDAHKKKRKKMRKQKRRNCRRKESVEMQKQIEENQNKEK